MHHLDQQKLQFFAKVIFLSSAANMSNGNATTTMTAPAAAMADSADVLDCGSLDANDFETIQVGVVSIGSGHYRHRILKVSNLHSRSRFGWRAWPWRCSAASLSSPTPSASTASRGQWVWVKRGIIVLRIWKYGLLPVLTVGGLKLRIFWPKDPKMEPKRIRRTGSRGLILRNLKVTVVHESSFWGSDRALFTISEVSLERTVAALPAQPK